MTPSHARCVRTTRWTIAGYIGVCVVIILGLLVSLPGCQAESPQARADQLEMTYAQSVAALNDAYDLRFIPDSIWVREIKPARIAARKAIDQYKTAVKIGVPTELERALQAAQAALESLRTFVPSHVTTQPSRAAVSGIELGMAILMLLARGLAPTVAKALRGEDLTPEERAALEAFSAEQTARAEQNDRIAEDKLKAGGES